jgi:hypothetical protein
MRISAGQVLGAFMQAMADLHLTPVLGQRDVKAVAVKAVAAICRPNWDGAGGNLHLWVDRLDERAIEIAQLSPRSIALWRGGAMSAVAVCRGNSDPHEGVLTARIEANPRLPLRPTAYSEKCSYSRNLFMLLNVSFPCRLFIAQLGREGAVMLGYLMDRILRSYQADYRDGDRVFSVVLPTAEKGYSEVCCRGWEMRRGMMRDLEPATWRTGTE